jgi:hypothetical protein
MPIYEYYCPENHRIYQFYAKTLAQGRTTPRCPDNPAYRMEKMLSSFAVAKGAGNSDSGAGGGADSSARGADPLGSPDDARSEAALAAMESEFASVDESDPRAMGRMMRRMSELTGEKIGGEMEEVVRKLEEGADPESLEDQLGGAEDPGAATDAGADTGFGGAAGAGGAAGGEGLKSLNSKGGRPVPDGRAARPYLRREAPRRDPKLYDYE